MIRETFPANEFADTVGECWILTETLLRARDLQREFGHPSGSLPSVFENDSNRGSTSPRSTDVSTGTIHFIGTRGDGFQKLLRHAFLKDFKVLADPERNTLLSALMTRDGLQFPILSSEQSLKGISKFLDLIRIRDLDEFFLRSVVSEELSQFQTTRERLEELILFRNLVQEEMRERGLYDYPALLELFVEKLAASPKLSVGRVEVQFPEKIIFDTPFSLSPLESHVVRALSRHLDVKVLLSEFHEAQRKKDDLSLEKRYFRTLFELGESVSTQLFTHHSDLSSAGLSAAVADALLTPNSNFDAENSSLQIQSYRERRDEVAAVTKCIAELLFRGASPAKIQIISLDTDSYGPLFSQECAKQNVPLEIPRGESFSLNPFSGRVHTLLSALLHVGTSPAACRPYLSADFPEIFLLLDQVGISFSEPQEAFLELQEIL